MADQADTTSGTAITLGPDAAEHIVEIGGHRVRVAYEPDGPADIEGHGAPRWGGEPVADVEGHASKYKFEPVADVEGHGRFKFEPVADVEGHVGRIKFEPVADVEGHCIRGRGPEGHSFTLTFEPVPDVDGHAVKCKVLVEDVEGHFSRPNSPAAQVTTAEDGRDPYRAPQGQSLILFLEPVGDVEVHGFASRPPLIERSPDVER